MGRSQSQLRDRSRQGVDSRGLTIYPGTTYDYAWSSTWPSGSLQGVANPEVTTIDGTPIPANTAAGATAVVNLTVEGVQVATGSIAIASVTKANALTTIAAAVQALPNILTAASNGTIITVTADPGFTVGEGTITYTTP